MALPLLQPELDPDTLRSDLRDFIQELRETQRERVKEKKSDAIGRSSQGHLGPGNFIRSRWCFIADFQDDAKCKVGVLERELEEMTGEQGSTQSRLTQLQHAFQEYQEGHCSSSLTI